MSLAELGWGPFFEAHFKAFRAEGLIPARVAREERDLYGLYGEFGRRSAEVTGRMRHLARTRMELPAVGDWVAAAMPSGDGPATIQTVLPRKSRISRHQAGPVTIEQIIAANIDVAFLVSGLDGGRNFHVPTIERYVTLARESGASPVVLLNKSDLCADPAACAALVEHASPGVPVHALSALAGHGLDVLRQYLVAGKTAVFLGRSGVGKSLLINRLVGSDLLPIGDVRLSDREGRHTTTWREMILIPSGGIVIDTPGMREIQLWGGGDEAVAEFPEIEALALTCKFSDCRHLTEPGCAVLAAVAAGTIDAARLNHFRNLRDTKEQLGQKQLEKVRMERKAAHKRSSEKNKNAGKNNPKERD
jgi:ribosome biogenesis GTPase